MQTVLRSTQGIPPGQSFISNWYPIPGVSVAFPLQMAAGGPAEAAYLSFSVYSDQPGTLVFQETDDSTNANLIHTIPQPSSSFAFNAGSALFGHGILVKRSSWRVIATNTGSAQRTFELCVNQLVGPPEVFDGNGNLLVAVNNSTPLNSLTVDPQSLLTAPSPADSYRVQLAILRELRINNMLLLRVSEPYASSASASFNLAEPDGIGVDPN